MRNVILRLKAACLLLFFIGWSDAVFAQPQLVCTPAAVRGRVIDANGQPIAGAQLFVQNQPYGQDVEWYASQPEENAVLGTGTSNADGHFTINWDVTQVTPLKNTSVMASLIAVAPGYALGYTHFTMWRPQKTEIVLEAESVHFGKVVDDQGQPLANAEVLVDAIHANMTSVHRGMIFSGDGLLSLLHSTLRPRTTTDGNGKYSFRGLPKGHIVLLQVTHPKFPAIRRFQPIDESSPQQIEAGQANNRFSEWRASYAEPMAMATASKREVVAVDRTTGEIVPGVKVCRNFDGVSVEADPNGRLAIWLNDQGHYYAQRSGEGQWSDAFLKEADGAIDQLQIASPKALLGKVVDARSGLGIEDVAVFVGIPGSPRFDLAYTDKNGRYSMTTYQSVAIVTLAGPCMKYRLPVSKMSNLAEEPSADLDAELHTRRIQFAGDQHSAEANFSLPRYPAVHVKVVGGDERPVANANVCLNSAYDYLQVKSMATSDQNGFAELSIDRPISQSHVWVAGEIGFAVEVLNSIPNDVVVLKLAPTIRIHGNISARDQEGNHEVVAGLPVFIRSAEKRFGLELGTTNEDGDFAVYLPPVAGGRVVFYVDFYSDRKQIQVDLAEGARADFVLESK